MFHIFYKLSKSVIIPFIFVIVEAEIKRRKNQEFRWTDLCCKWFSFWVIGFGAVSVGLMQALNPAYTANLLNVQTSDMIVIRELGCAQIGMGVIGLLSIRFYSFRKPAAMSYGLFILGAVILHIARLEHINIGEIVSLVDDVWTVGVAVFIILQKRELKIAPQNNINPQGKKMSDH